MLEWVVLLLVKLLHLEVPKLVHSGLIRKCLSWDSSIDELCHYELYKWIFFANFNAHKFSLLYCSSLGLYRKLLWEMRLLCSVPSFLYMIFIIHLLPLYYWLVS